MNNFNLKKYLAEGILLKESPASNLIVKKLAKVLFTKFKKSGARVKLSTDVGTVDQDGMVDKWDDISQRLGDHDVLISYGYHSGKEGIHLALVGEKANSLEDEVKDFVNKGDVEIQEFPKDLPFTDSKGKNRRANSYFILPGKSLSESNILLKEGIPQESEIADYVEAMFNDSVVEKEGFQSDIWRKEQYAANDYREGSVFLDLVDHLKSVGGKDVLEGNPDIHLELLSNDDIQWSADVTFD